MFQHLLRHLASDGADRLVAGPALGQIRDQRVTVIVPSASDASPCSVVSPRCFQSHDRASRIMRPPAEGGVLQRPWWRYWKPCGQALPPVRMRLPDGSEREFMLSIFPRRMTL